ncbi:MATE family efflux transporter [Chelatococcus reniformis]|uniref:MATE family efflux transporter n=1 Tax=Chelatococcus reniformis TaxID=1494448 RepID=A0A916USV4_9HYPH|nr:MATE family efflux transporter [Chelatococcus reniformis]GGC83375.1 MATE family efflux transporter [Chelatococcus reniformis]
MAAEAARPGVRAIQATHRRFVTLAVPMMLSHVTTPLLGLVDATVIGRLGDAALLGGVALGAVVFDFLFWAFGALRMGTAGLTAQAYGGGDDHEIDATLARALVAAALVGLVLIGLQGPLATSALALMGGSDAVAGAAHTYITIRIFAAPFTLANFAILGSVIGRARTDLGLLLQVGINCLNILLALVFVGWLHWGVAGVAAATVLAEMAGAGLGLMVLRHLGARPWAVPRAALLEAGALKRMVAVNVDIMVRTVALVGAFAFFTAQGARSSDTLLAANAVLYNLFLIGSYFLDGFATAAEQLGGQAFGGRDGAGFRKVVRLALIWSVGVGCIVSLAALAGGGAFIDLVTTNEAVRAAARQDLVFAALTPALGAAAFAFDGIYIGATWTRAMRNLMLAAFALFIAAALLLRPLGNDGLWLAMLLFLAGRGFGQAALYPSLLRRSFAAAPSPEPKALQMS